MARPIKEGLDYFPLDVDMDDKMEIIEATHGLIGFSIVLKLFMRIYKNGYSFEWNEKEQLLLSSRVNVDINHIKVIVNDCLKWGIFNESLFHNEGILTSRGIQRRYLKACERRKKVEINKKHCLLSEEDINVYKNLIVVDDNSINDNNALPDVDISTQSKVKESKVLNNNNNKSEPELNAAKFYDENIARISPIIVEKIADWENDLPPDVVVRAMQEAVEHEKRSWKYIETILKDWLNKGVKSIHDAERALSDFKQSKIINPFRQSRERKVAEF